VRFGEPPDARILARLIAPNRRLLCASPAYLARHGTPKSPAELAQHNCIGIRQADPAYGTWRLRSGRRSETVKVRGSLSTNDGEIAVNWALAGHGIVMRAEWDVARYLRSGRLKQVLENWHAPPADIYAVYPQRHQASARVRAFVDFLADHFGKSTTRAAGLVGNW
jgi:DNA-binding transcriptional LysR family regulator